VHRVVVKVVERGLRALVEEELEHERVRLDGHCQQLQRVRVIHVHLNSVKAGA